MNLKEYQVVFSIVLVLIFSISVSVFPASEFDNVINKRGTIYISLISIIRLMDVEDRNLMISGSDLSRIKAAYILKNILDVLELLKSNPELMDKIQPTENERYNIYLLQKELGPELRLFGLNLQVIEVKVPETITRSTKLTKNINQTTVVKTVEEYSEYDDFDFEDENYYEEEFEPEIVNVKAPEKVKKNYITGMFSAMYNNNLLQGENYYDQKTMLPVFESTGEYFTQVFNLKVVRSLKTETDFFLDLSISYDSLDIPVNFEFERDHIYYKPKRFNYSLNLLEIKKEQTYTLTAGIIQPEFWSFYSLDMLSTQGLKLQFKKSLTVVLLKTRFPRVTWQDDLFELHPGNFESWGLGLRYKKNFTKSFSINGYLLDIEDNPSSLPVSEREKQFSPKDELELYSLTVLDFSIDSIDEIEKVLNDINLLKSYLTIVIEQYLFTYYGGNFNFLGFEDLKELFYLFQTFYDEFGRPIDFPEPIPRPYPESELENRYTDILIDLDWVIFEINSILTYDFNDSGVLVSPELTGARINNINNNMVLIILDMNRVINRINKYSSGTSFNYCTHVLIPLWKKIKKLNTGLGSEIGAQMDLLISETYRLMGFGLRNLTSLSNKYFNDAEDLNYIEMLAIPTEPETLVYSIQQESFQIIGSDIKLDFKELENSHFYSEVSIMRKNLSGEEDFASAAHSNLILGFGNFLLRSQMFNIGSAYSNPMIHRKINPLDQATVIEERNYPYQPGMKGGELDTLLKVPIKEKTLIIGAGFKTTLWELEEIYEETKFGKLGLEIKEEYGNLYLEYNQGLSLFESRLEDSIYDANFTRVLGNFLLRISKHSNLNGNITSEIIKCDATDEILLRKNKTNLELKINLGNFHMLVMNYIIGEKISPNSSDCNDYILQGTCNYIYKFNEKSPMSFSPEFRYKLRRSIEDNKDREKLKEWEFGILYRYSPSDNFTFGANFFYTSLSVEQPFINVNTGEVEYDIFNESISGESATFNTISGSVNFKPAFFRNIQFFNEATQRLYTYESTFYEPVQKETRFHNKFRLTYNIIKKDLLEGNFEYTNLLWKTESISQDSVSYHAPKKTADIIGFNFKIKINERSDILMDYKLNRLFEDSIERNYSKIIVISNWRF
ncbi:hypothetical protein KAU33_11545 [Candidatus Dependentiae bacterium]|nr:hypothetical protein [Candidatus Dependentiae bacterium]